MAASASNPNPNIPNNNNNVIDVDGDGDGGFKLKLLIDTQRKIVLFAEANKDFIDFLFTLVSLPMAYIIKILSNKGVVGCLGKLFHSIENFNTSYFQPNLNKETLLNPNLPPTMANSLKHPLLFPNSPTSRSKASTRTTSNKRRKLYICPRIGYANYGTYPGFHNYVTDDPRAQCPQCHSKITAELNFVATDKGGFASSSASGEDDDSEGKGYVKDQITYMVMDDLQVKPLSLVSTLSMLTTFNVKDTGTLEEKIVSIGIDEGLQLLKASMETETVLTDVLLKKV